MKGFRLKTFALATVALAGLSTGPLMAAVGKAVMVMPDDITWGPAPEGLPQGVQMAVLDGDPTKEGAYTVRIRLPARAEIPLHSHSNPEAITVISGQFHFAGADGSNDAGTVLPAGSFMVLPAGDKHRAWVDEDTVIQITSEGPFDMMPETK